MKEAYVTLTFVTPEEIREVNSEQRGMDKETDCLSFPMFDIKNGSFSEIPSAGDYETDEDGNEALCYGDILINLSDIPLNVKSSFLPLIHSFIFSDMTISKRKMKLS